MHAEGPVIWRDQLGSVVRLAGEMGRDGRYRALMRELEVVDPGSFALSRYRLFQSVSESAEKTAACIFSFLASKLAPFSFGDAVRVFTNPERINIKELGRKKTAVFLNISDTDDTAPKAAGKAASAGKETFRAVAKAGAGTYKASFRMLFVQPATSGGCRQKKRKQTAGCGINI